MLFGSVLSGSCKVIIATNVLIPADCMHLMLPNISKLKLLWLQSDGVL